jgi:hypothetical protein
MPSSQRVASKRKVLLRFDPSSRVSCVSDGVMDGSRSASRSVNASVTARTVYLVFCSDFMIYLS